MRRPAATAAESNARGSRPRIRTPNLSSVNGAVKFVVALALLILSRDGGVAAQISPPTSVGARFIVTAAPKPLLDTVGPISVEVPSPEGIPDLESSVQFDWTPCLEDVRRLAVGYQIIDFTVEYTPAYGTPTSPLRLDASLAARVSINRTLPAVLYTACLVAEFLDGSRREIFQQSALSSPLPPSLISYTASPTALELRYAPPRSGYDDEYDRAYLVGLYDYYIEYERVGRPADRNYIYSNATALRIRRLAPDAAYALRVYARLAGVSSIVPLRIGFRTPALRGSENTVYSPVNYHTTSSEIPQYPAQKLSYPAGRLYFVPLASKQQHEQQLLEQKLQLLSKQQGQPQQQSYDKRLILQEQQYLQLIQQQQQQQLMSAKQHTYNFVVQQKSRPNNNTTVVSKRPVYSNSTLSTVGRYSTVHPTIAYSTTTSTVAQPITETIPANTIAKQKSTVILQVPTTTELPSSFTVLANMVDEENAAGPTSVEKLELEVETIDVGGYRTHAPAIEKYYSGRERGNEHVETVDEEEEHSSRDEGGVSIQDQDQDREEEDVEGGTIPESTPDEDGQDDEAEEENDEEDRNASDKITVSRAETGRQNRLRVEWRAPETTLCDEFTFNYTVHHTNGNDTIVASRSTQMINTSAYVEYVNDTIITVQVYCMLEGVLTAGSWSAQRDIDLRRPASVSNLRVTDAQTDEKFTATVRLAFDRPAGQDSRYYCIHVTWALGKKIVGAKNFVLKRRRVNTVSVTNLLPARLYTFTVRNASRELNELASAAVGLRQMTPPAIASTLTADAVGAAAALVRFDTTDPAVHSFDHYELVFVNGPNGKNVTRTVAKHATRRAFNFTQLAPGRTYRFVLYTVAHGGQHSRPVVAEMTTYPLKVEHFVAVCGPGYAVLHWQAPGMPRDAAAGHFRLSYLSRANNGEARTSRDVHVNGTERSHRFARLEPDAYYTFAITVVSADGSVTSDASTVTVGFAGKPRFMPILKRYGSRELFENDRHTFPDLNGVIDNFAVIVAEEIENVDDGFDLRSWNDVHTLEIRPAYRTSPADYHPFKRRGAPKLAAFVIGEENCDDSRANSDHSDDDAEPSAANGRSSLEQRYCNGPLAPRVDYYAKIRAYSVANVAMETDWVTVYDDGPDELSDRRHGGYGRFRPHGRRRPCHMYLNGCDDEDDENRDPEENSDNYDEDQNSLGHRPILSILVTLFTIWCVDRTVFHNNFVI